MASPTNVTTSSVTVTGKISDADYFRILERSTFEPAEVVRVMRGEVAGVIFRGAIPRADCERVRQNFWASPLLRKRGDAVPAHYLGTYHYGKELDRYFREAEETRAALTAIFAGTDNIFTRIMGGVADTLKAEGVAMRVAEQGGRRAGEFVMRSWTGTGSFALAAHDDGAQMTDRRQAGFEIQSLAQGPFAAVNLCLENGEGGELVCWNLQPDAATRRALGVEETGYPYPVELLGGFDKIELPIRTGDAYFFNGQLVHAVRASARPGDHRSTISLLMGFKDPKTVIYWT
jgi:hypothetical protein